MYLQTYSTDSDSDIQISPPNMNNPLTSTDYYLQQNHSTSTEPPLCEHVQTVQGKTKSASFLVKENYHKFTKTGVKKNLLPWVFIPRPMQGQQVTMNIPDPGGKGITNV